MKNAKEFIEKFRADEAFAAKIKEAVKVGSEGGILAAVSKAAAELGYEIGPEQLKALAADLQGEGLSDGDLDKIAGGYEWARPRP